MAARRVIVDGMNVIGSRPDGWWRDRTAAMSRLARQVGEWASRTGEEVMLVLDGRGRELGVEDVHVVWAPGGRDAADDRIVELLRDDPDAGDVEVVTSDRGLASRVRDLGAQVTSSKAFLRELEGG